MADGLLRTEPGGDALLTLRYADDRSFAVLDESSNLVGNVRLRNPGCEVLDARGRPLADVVRVDSGPGRAIYKATISGIEVCRYTWSSGAGPLNPLLLVDFETGTEFDRGVALVIAPFLEEEARLESEKYFRSYP